MYLMKSCVDNKKLVLIIVPSLFLFIFLCLSISITNTTVLNPFMRNFFVNGTIQLSFFNSSDHQTLPLNITTKKKTLKQQLDDSKIAVCLVGGARKFELTGQSIVDYVLKEYPNSDLFLNSPLDSDSFKFSLLKEAPRLTSIRIFTPAHIPETPEQIRVLTAQGSPNGIQGLLQYFSLVEGCLTLINAYQKKNNFTYDWIIRTRVDGYWNAPLKPESFVSDKYLVPSGSTYWGLNDRLGIGDFNTSTVALSRFSILTKLISMGLQNLNSESAFKAQFTTHGVPVTTQRIPFCVVTDRKYNFPPVSSGVPVAATSSPGPLSGVKCRPCSVPCKDKCADDMMRKVHIEWGWTDWGNGTLELCDARHRLENGWELVFDKDAGNHFAEARKRIWALNFTDCVRDFEQMRSLALNWEAPPIQEICSLGGLKANP